MSGEVLLQGEGISKRFGGLEVLRDVTVGLKRNTLHSVIGPNGAGKSTLFDVLSGVQFPDSGSVLFDGRDVTSAPAWRRARDGVLRKFQAPSVFRNLTVSQNIAVAESAGSGVPGLISGRGKLADEDLKLARMGLDGLGGTLAGEMSHGFQQRLEIAMLLATDPQVVLLDEPAAGATQRERKELGQLLRALADSLSIFVVEHDLRFIREVSDEVSVLDRGRLIAHGSVDEVAQDERVRSVFLGKQDL